jgi:hypothetical protein
MYIAKKAEDRIKGNLAKFQKILTVAKDRDVNESDTVQIITDILQDIFGYDKYNEVTSELNIKGAYCDLAIKIDNKYPYLIEVKAIGLDLKEKHTKQAIDYGANKGINWVILTNGIIWNVYRIRFEQPISADLVFSFDMLSANARNDKDFELIYMLCREALDKNIKEEYYEKIQTLNKYVVGGMLLSDAMITYLRREIKRFAGEVRIDKEDILDILQKEVLKREVIEGDGAIEAQKKLKKYFKSVDKQKQASDSKTDVVEDSEPVNDNPVA